MPRGSPGPSLPPHGRDQAALRPGQLRGVKQMKARALPPVTKAARVRGPSKGRAIRLVRPGQVTDARQEFADDLPSGEAKRSAKELRPRLRRAWVMRVQPAGKRPVRLP